MHNLISQVITDCSGQLAKDDPDHELKVVKVNATLLEANESKILMQFCETLGLKEQSKQFYTVEMISEIQKYFTENKKVSLLFVFEDIDYYISETKQVLLYKILDMLQYCQIKFLLIATSMKVDIVDSFEKRVKSRFSHRQVILYDYSFVTLMTTVR